MISILDSLSSEQDKADDLPLVDPEHMQQSQVNHPPSPKHLPQYQALFRGQTLGILAT